MNPIFVRGRRVLDRVSRATDRAMGPRNSILDRVRFLFLAFLVFNAAIGAFLILRGPRQDLTQLIASYSLTYLVFYAVWGYLRGKVSLWLDLVATVALFGVGLQVTDLVRLYLLFYGVLLFRCLFGTGWGVVTVTTLFLSALVASVAVTSFSVAQPALAAQVLVNIPGFSAGAWLMHQVKRTLVDYIEALRRERVLTESADDLVAAENAEAVYDAGIRGALGLVAQVRGARAALAVGTVRTQRQVATGPPARLIDVPESKVAALPDHLRQAVEEMHQVSGRVVGQSLLAGRGEDGPAPPFTGWATGQPLSIEGKLRGLISVAGLDPLPPGVGDGLSRLGSSLALALERVNLAEDLRRSTDNLKSSEARFRSLVQNSSDVITLLDEQGRISYVSPAVEKLLGYETGKLLNTTLWRVVHPQDLNVANATFQELLRTD